jgi:Zn-dependent protease
MVSFTPREVRDIIISMSAIAIIFASLISGFKIQNTNINNLNVFIALIPALLIAVGLGFVLHELAHKFVAVRYGFYAEFRMWFEGLALAFVMAFVLGFVFVAPGAVYIHGNYISREENGKISIAGPLVNIVIALFFFSLIPFVNHHPVDITGFIISNIIWFGFIINSILAAFNLIPLGIFDGAKIIRWNPILWVLTTAVAVTLSFYAYTMIYSTF